MVARVAPARLFGSLPALRHSGDRGSNASRCAIAQRVIRRERDRRAQVPRRYSRAMLRPAMCGWPVLTDGSGSLR
jgi:hypothetical protein